MNPVRGMAASTETSSIQHAIARLAHVLADTPEIAFAVLIGSHANGTAHESSDWDIAIHWKSADTPFERLGRHEALRQRLAQYLQIQDKKIDLVDLSSARLAMKAVVANEGQVLHNNDELAWAHFLTTTWRELEDYYWDRTHAA